MNQRIRELLAQCTQESIDGPFASPYVDQEKFAELLVQECADIALKSGNIANKNISAKVESERIYHKIKEHFGVEQ